MLVCSAYAQPATTTAPFQVEAAKGDGHDDNTPPKDGWQPVTLPDRWGGRWPGHDGLVWYRLRWNSTSQQQWALVDSVGYAATFFHNGQLIAQDVRQREPISRSTSHPQLILLNGPPAVDGTNTLMVRVWGYSGYRGGLGRIRLGSHAELADSFASSWFFRQPLHWISLGVSLAMGILFGGMWLLRRQESVFGWYAARALSWLPVGYDQVSTLTSPFRNSYQLQAASTLGLVCFSVANAHFILRFAALEMPRVEWILRASCIVAGACLFLLPIGTLPLFRDIWALYGIALYQLSCVAFVVYVLRKRREREYLLLALFLGSSLFAGVYDTIIFLGLMPGETYYSSRTSLLMVLCMALLLAWRYAKNMRLVERYNIRLNEEVAVATRKLREISERERAAELAKSRMTERLSMLHDLHDGLGSMLTTHITAIKSGAASQTDAAAALNDAYQELRLIVDQPVGEERTQLQEALAPLRSRMTSTMEAVGIDLEWTEHGLEGLSLSTRTSLDVLRILQEACSNVLKHSAATEVQVTITRQAETLQLEVMDNGVGIGSKPGSDGVGGIGLHSLRQRAQRLNGQLQIGPAEVGGTRLQLLLPLDAAGHHAFATQTRPSP